MRRQKLQGPRGAVLRVSKKTIVGIQIGKRSKLIRPRGDEEDDDEYYWDDAPHRAVGSIEVEEQKTRRPEFTGILDEHGARIFRFYMQKPGIGFNVEGMDDFDPDAYMFGINPDFVVTTGDEHTDEEEEDDGSA